MHLLTAGVNNLLHTQCHKIIRTAAPTCKEHRVDKACKHLVKALGMVLMKALAKVLLVGLMVLSRTLVWRSLNDPSLAMKAGILTW